MGAVMWVSLAGTFQPGWGGKFQVFEAFTYRAQIEEIAPGARRPLSIEGNVRNVTSERDGSTALASRTPFDHGGHLIAARFGGPTCPENLVPMHGAINQSGGRWFRMEGEIAALLGEDRGMMRVRVQYGDDLSVRPTAFQIEVSRHDGRSARWHIENGSPLLLDPRDPEHWRAKIALRLRERGARPSKAVRQRIAGSRDVEQLRTWHDQLAAGTRPASLFGR